MSLVKKLYEKYSETGKDFLLSPYSIHVALAMAKEGAGGKTLDEMAEVLGPDPELIEASSVKTANAIWLLCEADSAWRMTVWRKYGGEAKDIRGIQNPAGMIDQWVSEKTNGKIDRIMPGPIDEGEKLIITNAIHFKDDWLHQFKKELTKKDDFYISDSDTVSVDMMQNTEIVSYSQTSAYQAIRLKYKGGDVSMTIILPLSRTGRVSFEDIQDVRVPHMYKREVKIYLPKFKMERTYFLKRVLQELGMPTAFTEYADFFGISREGLKIDTVIHKTFIEVDEEGTEAAAATVVGMVRLASMAPTPRPVVFRADHPFAFYIEDEKTKTVLFIGSVNHPGLEASSLMEAEG